MSRIGELEVNGSRSRATERGSDRSASRRRQPGSLREVAGGPGETATIGDEAAVHGGEALQTFDQLLGEGAAAWSNLVVDA